MCPRKHVLCFHVIQPSVSGYYPPATKHNGIIEAILWWKGVTPWDEELPSVLLSSFNEVLVETSSIAAQLKVGCEMVWKEFGSTWLGEMEWEKQWKVSKEKEGKVREGETSERWWCEERLQVWAVNAKAESRGNLGENLPCGWGWWTRRSRRREWTSHIWQKQLCQGWTSNSVRGTPTLCHVWQLNRVRLWAGGRRQSFAVNVLFCSVSFHWQSCSLSPPPLLSSVHYHITYEQRVPTFLAC